LVVVRSQVAKLGRSSVTHHHAMHGLDDDRLHSRLQVVTVFFDLEARKAAPLPELVRERAATLFGI